MTKNVLQNWYSSMKKRDSNSFWSRKLTTLKIQYTAIMYCGLQGNPCNLYTKSLVNTNSFYTNFINMHFQKVPNPHLTPTMKKKFLH